MMKKAKFALITTLFNPDEKRLSSLEKSIKNLKKQSEAFNHYLIELTNSHSFIPPSLLEDVIYKEIKIKEENNGLWQKEAIYNLYGDYIGDEEVLIFIDGDIGVEDRDWLRKIEEKLDDSTVLQPYKNVFDTDSPILNFSSIASYHHLKESDFPPHGAGTVWAFKRSVFKEIEGFNALYPEGSGDTAFLMEFLPKESIAYSSYIERYEWFMSLLRERKDNYYKLEYLDTDLIHYNHGMERYYTDRANYLRLLKKSPLQYFELCSSSGILKWKNKESNVLKKLINIIFKKLNSNFENLALKELQSFLDSGELLLKEDNSHALDAKSSLMIEGKNWAFIRKENNNFYVEALNPIKENVFLFFFLDTKRPMHLDLSKISSKRSFEVYDEAFERLLREKTEASTNFQFQNSYEEPIYLKLTLSDILDQNFSFSLNK